MGETHLWLAPRPLRIPFFLSFEPAWVPFRFLSFEPYRVYQVPLRNIVSHRHAVKSHDEDIWFSVDEQHQESAKECIVNIDKNGHTKWDWVPP